MSGGLRRGYECVLSKTFCDQCPNFNRDTGLNCYGNPGVFKNRKFAARLKAGAFKHAVSESARARACTYWKP